ncbi:hypothetical protein E2K98_12900 [Bacillus salipaludis]|uniref:Uncharacterized protein n=1 Tax=Bacillus salipaludis TaxID=2547811 RepID=A0A4R5VUU7_9BACI|nr:hypothetical protein [Bacillus salipaludis]TDK61781.1 hypothetical protein E2K98_12900 [Bacillus salipaludis]
MKDYFIRLIFGLLTIGVVLGIAYIFNFEWLKDGELDRNLYILPIAIVGGWVGWYLYKGIKRRNDNIF